MRTTSTNSWCASAPTRPGSQAAIASAAPPNSRNSSKRAFAELSPHLTIQTMLSDGDQVACELTEQLVVDDTTRVDHIAGFYRVHSGRITEAKIYREGSADA